MLSHKFICVGRNQVNDLLNNQCIDVNSYPQETSAVSAQACKSADVLLSRHRGFKLGSTPQENLITFRYLTDQLDIVVEDGLSTLDSLANDIVRFPFIEHHMTLDDAFHIQEQLGVRILKTILDCQICSSLSDILHFRNRTCKICPQSLASLVNNCIPLLQQGLERLVIRIKITEFHEPASADEKDHDRQDVQYTTIHLYGSFVRHTSL